jgi:hypothetical protein
MRFKNKIKLNLASLLSNSISQKINSDGYILFPKFINLTELDLITRKLNDVDERKFKKYDNDIRLFSLKNNLDSVVLKSLNLKMSSIFKKNVFLGFIYKHFFMFNRIISSGIGSGGDWHRDSGYLNQFKLIIFLNGTDENNGPFEIVEKSHSISSILKVCKYFGLNKSVTRFKNSEIQSLLKSSENDFKIKSFHLNPGDAIFVNTRAIHRGKPAKRGGRLALTSYSFINTPKHMQSLFDE